METCRVPQWSSTDGSHYGHSQSPVSWLSPPPCRSGLDDHFEATTTLPGMEQWTNG